MSSATLPPWLLLIHQVPSKPDYLRVKVSRRLQQVGSVAVKSSVYALPNREDCRESFEWILREIVDGGGEGLLCAVELVEGLDSNGLRQLFLNARGRDYHEIAKEAAGAAAPGDLSGGLDETERPRSPASVLGRLERRLAATRVIDYFSAPERTAAEAALAGLRERLAERRPTRLPAPPGTLVGGARVWVTRIGVAEDRIASAWLIRRFIDPTASFRFVDPGATRLEGELRFDMYEGDYTHEGDRCTFEVLLERFGLHDGALEVLAQIVHDVDLKDDKFARPETAGFARFIEGLSRLEPDDEKRIARGSNLLDILYAAFGGRS